MAADLHLHSCFSDGTNTPEELAELGKRCGLTALALTDHDSVEGCQRMADACARNGLDFVVGTELTAELENEELHLLGYFLDTSNTRLTRQLESFQTVRQNRIREMVARLNSLGIPLEANAVFNLANCRSPGRPHLARALVQEGFCRTLDEAFERFLKKRRPAWVPKFKMSATEAITLLRDACAVVVMAHPGLTRLDSFIPELSKIGLDGLECYHPKHSQAASAHYISVARKHGLVVTGGSDCHGSNKDRPSIGTVRMPDDCFELLSELASARRTGVHPVEHILARTVTLATSETRTTESFP